MSLKEDMKIRRNEYWKKKANSIKKEISEMLLEFQKEELFASYAYGINIVCRCIRSVEDDSCIHIFALVDNGESYSKLQYMTYFVRDYAIDDYCNLFSLVFKEMEIDIISTNSNFSMEDMEDGEEAVMIKGSIKLD